MSRTPASVVFAFVALLALVVQPLCAPYHLPAHAQPAGVAATATSDMSDGEEHGHFPGCCASVRDVMLAAPAAAVPPAFESCPTVLVASIGPAWRFSAFSVAEHVKSGAPPPPKSYYARSARILS